MKTQCNKQLVAAIKNFTNPFSIIDSLAYGDPCSAEVEHNVLQAETNGREAKEAFIKDRFNTESEKTFFTHAPRQKRLTMENSNKKVMLTSTHGNVNIF